MHREKKIVFWRVFRRRVLFKKSSAYFCYGKVMHLKDPTVKLHNNSFLCLALSTYTAAHATTFLSHYVIVYLLLKSVWSSSN